MKKKHTPDEVPKKTAKELKADKEKEQQELGAALQMFLESGYYTKRRLFIFSFLKGIATAVGGIVGATLVLALLLWLLSLFSEVPFVGHFTDSIQNTIEQSKPE